MNLFFDGHKPEPSNNEHSHQTITTINDTLKKYPHLHSIIPPCNSKTKLLLDQYKGNIPLARKGEVCESKIYDVLLNSLNIRQSFQLMHLEELLSQYPEYCNEEFGILLTDSFFSRYSEIDVYDELYKKGLHPDRDPLVMPRYKKSTKADFKIKVNGIDIFVEMFTPRLPLDEELDFGQEPKAGFFDTRKLENNNVYKKIFHEYEHHFKVFEPEYNSPTLIILDKTYAIGLSDIFGSVSLQGIYNEYQFPGYFIGIIDRTRYHIDSILKILNQPKKRRFYINPNYRDSMPLIRVLLQLFYPDKTGTT